MKTSLGLLEVSGLALAIGAADAMAKSASITLVGMEKTKGSGWMLIRIVGDVASVQAAIETGASFAEQHHGLIAQAILARPAESVMSHWQPTSSAPMPEIQAPTEIEPDLHALSELIQEETPIYTVMQVTCNLCQDPQCPRRKGEPRERCLHSVKGGKS